MSRGFTGTTQKQRRSSHNGSIHKPQGQRKHGRSTATSRFCWPFFPTPMGWCITNTHHKAKQSPKSTMRRYFVTFVMPCGTNDWTCGQQKLGSSITTMHPPILRIWFKVFWLNTTFLWFVSSLLSQHGPLWFLAVPQTENAAERDLIWVKRRHYAERDSPAGHDSTRRFPEMFPAMAGPLEEVCALPRRLLWRGLGFQTSK